MIELKKRKKDPIYIGKPTKGSQGYGIVLFNDIKDVPTKLHKNSNEYLVQEYISRPLLIERLKFDLRIYILVTCLEPFTVFIAKEGMSRFCTRQYSPPSKYNFSKIMMHLTNYSLNKKNEEVKYEFNGEDALNTGHKRTLSFVMNYLKERNQNHEIVWKKIMEICTMILLSFHPFLIF